MHLSDVYTVLASLAAAGTVYGVVKGLPAVRATRIRKDRMDRMLDDWHGEPARPGYKELPSFPERVTRTEQRLDGIEAKLYDRPEVTTLMNSLKVVEYNLADVHDDIASIEKRMDAGQRRALKAEGRTEEQLRNLADGLLGHVTHDRQVHAVLKQAGFALPPEPGLPLPFTTQTEALEEPVLPAEPRKAPSRARRIVTQQTKVEEEQQTRKRGK